MEIAVVGDAGVEHTLNGVGRHETASDVIRTFDVLGIR